MAPLQDIPLEALVALAVYDIINAKPKRKEASTPVTADPYSPWRHAGKWRIGD